jgi:hypothetical protein
MSVIINGSAGVTTNTGAVYDSIQRATAQASTSGTSIDFTSIPSWVRRITVMFSGVSTNGTSSILIQLGTSGGIVSSGYASTAAIQNGTASNSTAGFIVGASVGIANIASGIANICNLSGNTWIDTSTLKRDTGGLTYSAGDIALGGTLDRVRITTAGGTDTFDAGSINILYE